MLFIKLAAAMLACLALSPATAKASCSDLSLVLAIDSSSSIDPAEFALQIAGYSAAFSHPAVQNALAQTGVVDVAAVFWADAEFGPQIMPWQRIRSRTDAQTFAARLLATPRRATGDTDLGAGLMTALDMLEQPNLCTLRKVINVSGDGQASPWAKRRHYISLDQARARAKALDVTVNGLAIIGANPSLGKYYQDRLITGPGAFVMTVSDFDSFGAAIIQKLKREISLPVSASLN